MNNNRARYIVVPQILNAGAFLAALYASTTCEFINVKYDYDWTQAGSWLKTEVNFGMLSRETADKDSNECYWYTEQDFTVFFDSPFRASVVANVLSTLIGGLLFIYSLFLWCRLVTKSSIRFLCYVNTFCVVGGLLTYMVFFSDLCMVHECTQFFDGSQSACVDSYCELGTGSYLSMLAIALWIAAAVVTIRLLVDAEKQITEKKLLRQKKAEKRKNAQQDVEDRPKGDSTPDEEEGNINAEESKDEQVEDTKDEHEKDAAEESKTNDANDDEESNIKVTEDKVVMQLTPFSVLMGGKSFKKKAKDGTEEGKVEI